MKNLKMTILINHFVIINIANTHLCRTHHNFKKVIIITPLSFNLKIIILEDETAKILFIVRRNINEYILKTTV